MTYKQLHSLAQDSTFYTIAYEMIYFYVEGDNPTWEQCYQSAINVSSSILEMNEQELLEGKTKQDAINLAIIAEKTADRL